MSLRRTLVHFLTAASILVFPGASFAQQPSAESAGPQELPVAPLPRLSAFTLPAPSAAWRSPNGPSAGGEEPTLPAPEAAPDPNIPLQDGFSPGTGSGPGATPAALGSDSNEDKVGSTNVPMDSWIYPALERLGNMGLIPFQSMSIRPWTRQECRRQVQQAEEILAGVHGHYYDVGAGIAQEAERLLPQLEQALSEPDAADEAVLESAYGRGGTIAGPALTDGFHFGQTWENDFGRPLERGTSGIAGYSLRAIYGRFFLFDRQELQQSPTVPGVTAAESALFYQLDDIPFGLPGEAQAPPIPVSSPVAAYLRQRPLELYAGVAFAGNSVSFGKQELFWGPTTMGPWAFSSNAEPTYNLRFVATRPHPFPFFPTLGTYRFDLVFGKLSGHHFPARPYYNGEKVDFTFGRLLEMSFTRWAILFGVGHPMTLGDLGRNLFSFSSTGCGYGYGDRCDPGDRKGGFDFRLHVPGLRNYVTIYADSYDDDQPSPLQAPRRAAWNPGIYFARLPYLPHMDLRFEMSTSEGLSHDDGGTYLFINNQYRDGNTNKGFLLGNAVGRDARAFEGRSGYWFSARTRVEAGYRQTKGSDIFLRGGSTISDGFVNASYAITPRWSVQMFAQYERFLVPLYLPGSQHNESGWLQVVWNPNLSLFSKWHITNDQGK